MLSIGELSKLCRISTKTLRHYDKINLVKPVYVNDENGYRFYDVKQVKDIAFIGKMKHYGFSLSDILHMLSLSDTSKMKDLLLQQKKEMQRDLIHMQYFLKQIDKDLELFERGIDFMSNEYTVTLVERKPITIASVRRFMGIKNFDKAFEDLFELIESNKYTILGAPFALYHCEDFDPENTDIETAFPIKETIGEGVRNVDGGLCCMTLFKGPYIDFSPAYVALETWMRENSYVIADVPFEIYVKGMDSGLAPEDFETEIYFPVKKKSH